MAGMPGVVGGTLQVSLPSYPFVISTSYGEGVRQLSYPGVELRSESTERLTQASATGLSGGAGATSTARIVRDGDAVLATAVTDLDALRVGESIVISGLHASATPARDIAGELTRTSSLSFAALRVPGLTVGLADGAFTLTPDGGAPTRQDVPAGQVAAALTEACFPATYQAPQQTDNGIVGAGLQIQATLPEPPPGTPGGFSGETPVTISLGLVRAEVAYTVVPVTPAGVTPDPVQAAAPVGAVPQVPAGLPIAANLPGAVGAPALPVPAAPPPVVGTEPVRTIDLAALQASRAAVGSDVGWIYLMVVAAGAAGFGGTIVLLYRGVR